MRKTLTIISTVSRRSFSILIAGVMTAILPACEEFVTIEPPRTDLVKETVFKDDATANAALLDIYYKMRFNGFASGDATSLTYLGSISGDELIDYTANSLSDITKPFYTHTLTPLNGGIELSWNTLYSWIYKANAIIEGLETSGSSLTPELKNQLEGEARFIRAFCHFYLVNLWGDVPVISSTDYVLNSHLPGNPIGPTYELITGDLKAAQTLLGEEYTTGNVRTRPNRAAATALLARVYLYTSDWPNAEAEASKVIGDALYDLEDLAKVFQKTSKEVLWQLEPHNNYPPDISTFYIFSTPPTRGALRSGFRDLFEENDARRSTWIGTITDGDTYDFPIKYQSFVPLTEYSTILRLAEVYLIRAEARIHNLDYNGGLQDINAIRTRAGLAPFDSFDGDVLLAEIMNQRRLELFCEWGHRWLDLKRTGTVDAVMAPLSPGWKPEWALFPVPEYQVLNSPVKQNPGY